MVVSFDIDIATISNAHKAIPVLCVRPFFFFSEITKLHQGKHQLEMPAHIPPHSPCPV